MPTSLNATSELRSSFTQSHFGGNFLFHRDSLDGGGSYEELAEDLGLTTVRFPGGSVTEEYFDIKNPNNTHAMNAQTGEPVNLIPLDRWLEMAGELDISTTIVVPTKNFLSDEVDENGNRYAEFDRDALHDFVSDIVQGVHGDGKVAAFEIGNEYWGSGQMSAVEYGRLASEMSSVIDEALDESQAMGFETENIDIVVQAGTNFSYSSLSNDYTDFDSSEEILEMLSEEYDFDFSQGFTFSGGDINWTKVNNQLIMQEFDDDEINAIDGVATHVYTRGENQPGMRDFSTKLIEDTWGQTREGLDTYVTEWNLKSTSSLDDESDYGLHQAHELLEIVEQFPEHGVEAAYAWPILQNTRNAFSLGSDHDELTVSGEMFRMMGDTLPGNRPIDLIGSGSEETELSTPDVDVHAFGNPNELVLFLTSQSSDVTSSDFDLNGLMTGGENISVTYLGVEDGDAPGSRYAKPDVEEASASEINEEIFRDGVLHADLDALEVMMVVISQPDWSSEMETYWEAVSAVEEEFGEVGGVYDAEDLIASLSLSPDEDPPVVEPVPEDPVDEEVAGDGGMGIAAVLLGLLPILALAL
ncbi:hypothetical protein [Phaeobacter sp. HF9A]|uniref:hypothetical protein n=1 Tax=Phaeobacter sp. HF9A TaxID=2721561 RepID=UPI001431A5E0|nr:hypothetical protein [Phaeobacter sp. HF9A]NIZ15701.1 hypothetical protein [Phaeobacter sp. HF9A]